MDLDLSWLKNAKWRKGCFIEDYLLLAAIVWQLKPRTILEVGTSAGLGAVVLAWAARQSHAKAKVWTVDEDQRFGRENVHLVQGIGEHIEFVRGKSDDVLGRYKHEGQRFDLAFLDGDHSYAQARKDWHNVCHLSDVIVLHDTTQFTGLQQLVAEIRKNPEYETFQFVSAPGHRFKGERGQEGFITGMTLVQHRDLLRWLPKQAHRDHNGALLPGHTERQVPGLRGPFEA